MTEMEGLVKKDNFPNEFYQESQKIWDYSLFAEEFIKNKLSPKKYYFNCFILFFHMISLVILSLYAFIYILKSKNTNLI